MSASTFSWRTLSLLYPWPRSSRTAVALLLRLSFTLASRWPRLRALSMISATQIDSSLTIFVSLTRVRVLVHHSHWLQCRFRDCRRRTGSGT